MKIGPVRLFLRKRRQEDEVVDSTVADIQAMTTRLAATAALIDAAAKKRVKDDPA